MRRRQNMRVRRATRVVFSKISSVISAIVGFILCLPFILNVIVLGKNYHHIGIFQALMILGIMVGGLLFLTGIIGLFVGNTRNTAGSLEADMARTRFAAEQNMFKDKR